MTQWLIEEAAFAALELHETLARSGELERRAEQKRLVERAAELRALKEAGHGLR